MLREIARVIRNNEIFIECEGERERAHASKIIIHTHRARASSILFFIYVNYNNFSIEEKID